MNQTLPVGATTAVFEG